MSTIKLNPTFLLASVIALLLILPALALAEPPGQPFEALQQQIDELRAELTQAKHKIHTLKKRVAILESNSVLALDGLLTFDNSSGYATALFSGVNVQVVNGTGDTQTTNGLGNMIVGYNNPRNPDSRSIPYVCSNGFIHSQADCEAAGLVWAASHKSGSHNFVGGDRNSYSSFGGFIVGINGVINNSWATVSGGVNNIASGNHAHVSGRFNIGSGRAAMVSGGSNCEINVNEGWGVGDPNDMAVGCVITNLP